MERALFAQSGDGFGSPWLWILVGVFIAVVAFTLYLLFRERPPPGGPKIGE